MKCTSSSKLLHGERAWEQRKEQVVCMGEASAPPTTATTLPLQIMHRSLSDDQLPPKPHSSPPLQVIHGSLSDDLLPGEQEWEQRKERMAQMEAVLMSAIHHPNIVNTFKVGVPRAAGVASSAGHAAGGVVCQVLEPGRGCALEGGPEPSICAAGGTTCLPCLTERWRRGSWARSATPT